MSLTFDKSASHFVIDAFCDLKQECGMCGTPITKDNLTGVIKGVGFVCNNPHCHLDIANYPNDTFNHQTTMKGD